MSSDWFDHILEFVGRTHLVVLHFPIALIVVAAVVEVWRLIEPRVRRRAAVEAWRPSGAGTIMFVCALLGTVVSVVTGLVLGFDGGERVDLHRILGIVSGVVMLVTGAALLLANRPDAGSRAVPFSGRVYVLMLCVSAGLVGATGHFGGELTHGHGFLTKPLKAIFADDADSADAQVPVVVEASVLGVSVEAAEVFNRSVLPILEASCVECHGPYEAEDDIRLDTLAFVLDPDADMVRRGDGDGSELVYRIDLPHDDPDIMPPEDDGEPLTRGQVDVIRDWIDSLGE